MASWKGPAIDKKVLIALKKKKMSKKITILPFFLGGSFGKKKIYARMLDFKLGNFFLTRRKVWHKK